MKKYIQVLLIILLLIANNRTKAQWVQANGLNSGEVPALIISNGEIFAEGINIDGSSSLYASTNYGKSWTSIGLKNISVNALLTTSNGSTIFAGSNHGVFISTTNGADWEQVNIGLTDTIITSIACIGTNLFAGTSNSGVFLSSDNGMSWKQTNNELSYSWISSLSILNNEIIATTPSGIYYSYDNGSNWSQFSLQPGPINSLIVSGNSIFVCVYNGGTYRSADNGISWSWIGPKGIGIKSLALQGSKIIAGTLGNGIYVSTDNGTNWSQENTGIQSNESILNFTVDGTNIIAETIRSGIYISADSGSTWSQIGLPILPIPSLKQSGTDMIAGTVKGIYLSTDEGNNWKQTGLPGIPVLSFTNNKTKIFAGTNGNGIYYSDDNGNSWSQINNSVFTNTSIPALIQYDSIIFAGAYYSGVYYSTDNGINWFQSPIITAGHLPIYSLSFGLSSKDSLNILIGTGNGVYNTTLSGINWIINDTSLVNHSIYCLVTNKANVYAGTSNGVFVSSDYGVSWVQKYNSLSNHSIYSLAVNGNNIFAGTDSNGVYLSTDNGVSWMESGLPYLPAISLTIYNGILYAGGYGIWKAPLSELITNVKENHNIIPDNYSLYQNFPNPFNPSTTISFDISHSSFVTLKIFDMLGREIKTLVNGYKANGKYSVSFDASSLSSGVYFYEIESGDFSSIKKMILLK